MKSIAISPLVLLSVYYQHGKEALDRIHEGLYRLIDNSPDVKYAGCLIDRKEAAQVREYWAEVMRWIGQEFTDEQLLRMADLLGYEEIGVRYQVDGRSYFRRARKSPQSKKRGG